MDEALITTLADRVLRAAASNEKLADAVLSFTQHVRGLSTMNDATRRELTRVADLLHAQINTTSAMLGEVHRAVTGDHREHAQKVEGSLRAMEKHLAVMSAEIDDVEREMTGSHRLQKIAHEPEEERRRGQIAEALRAFNELPAVSKGIVLVFLLVTGCLMYFAGLIGKH